MNTISVRNIVINEGIPKVYVPVVGKTKEELLSEVEVLKSVLASVVERHMDWFEEVECYEKVVAIPQALREAIPEMSILVTFRSKREDGELEISIVAYVELNKATIDSGNVDLIDVGLFTGEAQVKELITHAHDKGARAITSSHDFDKTSSYDKILTRLEAMRTLGADIPKVTVMPTYKADVVTPLQATNDVHENFADRPVATTSMTDTGVLSRLCGEALGSTLTFSTAKKASAPGQVGIEDLKTVLSLLHKSL